MDQTGRRFTYEHQFIEDDAGYREWGAVVCADLDSDGLPEFVTGGRGGGFYHLYDLDPATRRWTRHVITNAVQPQVGAAAVDFDGDGRPEIFTVEMENRKTDGETHKPRWLALAREAAGRWRPHVLLDANLGSHCAVAADFDGDGRLELVGKVWRANAINGNGRRNHLDCLWPLPRR